MSDMKIQNTDTTTRLNTLTQTKNTMPSARGLSSPAWVKAGMKASKQAMKNTYTTGTSTRRGQREASAANTGVSASVAMKVAA